MGGGSSVEQPAAGDDKKGGDGKDAGPLGPMRFVRRLTKTFEHFISRQLSMNDVTEEKIRCVGYTLASRGGGDVVRGRRGRVTRARNDLALQDGPARLISRLYS